MANPRASKRMKTSSCGPLRLARAGPVHVGCGHDSRGRRVSQGARLSRCPWRSSGLGPPLATPALAAQELGGDELVVWNDRLDGADSAEKVLGQRDCPLGDPPVAWNTEANLLNPRDDHRVVEPAQDGLHGGQSFLRRMVEEPGVRLEQRSNNL